MNSHFNRLLLQLTNLIIYILNLGLTLHKSLNTITKDGKLLLSLLPQAVQNLFAPAEEVLKIDNNF